MLKFNWLTKLLLVVIISIFVVNIGYHFKSSYANPATLISMSSNLSSEVSSLIQRQAEAWQQAQVDQIIADFAEDAVFIVPGSTINGRDAIARAAEKYFDQYQNTQVEIHRIIYDHPYGAVQWSWRDVERQTGKKNYAEDAIIFELDNQQIVYWREYIEPQN